jgi:hypothetical protein
VDIPLWTVGHKVVDQYHSLSETEVPRLMLSGETCRQTYTTKVTHTPHLPEEDRKLLESYLRLADWNQTRQLITDLLHEPSDTSLLDELESIKKILDPKTPIVWLKETLSQ